MHYLVSITQSFNLTFFSLNIQAEYSNQVTVNTAKRQKKKKKKDKDSLCVLIVSPLWTGAGDTAEVFSVSSSVEAANDCAGWCLPGSELEASGTSAEGL